MPKLTGDLLNKGRRSLKVIVELARGHCSLNNRIRKRGLMENPMCRICQTEEEALQHILYEGRQTETGMHWRIVPRHLDLVT